MEFHKMHGAGNDFVLLDWRGSQQELGPDQARLIADRRLGIGCDQILILRDAVSDGALAAYEIRNSDGSPAGQCGNGARCIGLFLKMQGDCGQDAFVLDSPGGPVELRALDDGRFEVNMGVPAFDPGAIPFRADAQSNSYTLDSPWGPVEFGAVSMGNPHALVQVANIDEAPLDTVGEFLRAHPDFPDSCNVGFAQVESESAIRLRVLERGVGETLACGSGACAAVAILQKQGLASERTDVFLPGGHLVIQWRGDGSALSMTGPAEHVFRGTLNE